MWASAFLFIQPVLAKLKPYWKYIVGAIVLIALIVLIHNWYEGELDAAFKRGVAVTEAKDAAVLVERDKLNATIIADLKIAAAVGQAKLEEKIRENKTIADDFRTQLRARRVCSDERSGRSVPGDSRPTPIVDGAAANDGPVKSVDANVVPTVGDDLVYIGEQCQLNTDKLTTLQPYVTELLSKLKLLTKQK